jgi:plastocyanin
MKKITALLAVAALGLAACGSSNSSDTSSSASSSNSAASNSGGGYGHASKTTTASNSGGGKSTEVEMYDDYFQPKTITGAAGSTVKVELKNEGKNEHNFKIDGQKADADVESGKTATVSVVIPKSGSAQFYCEYHKGLGMVGKVQSSST